jgi:hypothetical protein
MNRRAKRKGRATRKDRRGVLILVVLSLLVLFTLIAITYVAISRQAKSGADSARNAEQWRPDGRSLLSNALGQLVVGTNSPNSVLAGHSLLEDMYGPPFLRSVNSASSLGSTGGQFVKITLGPATGTVEGELNGRVLTMLDGPAAMQSTRIVYSNNTTVYVMAFKKRISSGAPAIPEDGDRLLINGAAFSGTGFGYNDSSGRVDAMLGGHPVALLPNISTLIRAHYSDGNGDGNLLTYQGAVTYFGGGLNEDYDAPDYQNMLLAMVPPDATGSEIIPSLHRPSLIKYFAGNGAWADLSRDMLRKIMLRPLPDDVTKPDFTGKIFDPVNGPWDVDTDGDGVLDSVWVDLGFPVLSGPRGQRYKPMFAIHCVDLDGRMSVNPHGNLKQTESAYYNQATGAYAGDSGTSTTVDVPRSPGVGPAEINLRYLFQGDNLSKYASLVEERYGNDQVPGEDGDDKLSQIRQIGVPDSLAIFTNNTTRYGSPPDYFGRIPVGVDMRGQVVYPAPASITGELSNDPYEMRLSTLSPRGWLGNQATDRPFSIAEFEGVMRRHDIDGPQLPDRLWQFAASMNSPRQSMTVASFNVPRLSVALPFDLRDGASPAKSLVDLVERKVSSGAAAWMKANLAPELIAGVPMNLNRPLGNGKDDSGATGVGSGVVDEPGTAGGTEKGESETGWVGVFPSSGGGVAFDLNNDGTIDKSDRYARAQFARHLYCLAMLLKDDDFLVDRDADADDAEETARYFAQWAVNVVDFMDRDTIMTQFAYDPEPFDGWNVSKVVFGCERPELLITETLVWHDRRVALVDTDGEPDPDGTSKQVRRPSGSIAIELFHPSNESHPRHGEIETGTGATRGLVLDKTHSGTNNAGSPVWRIVISNKKQSDLAFDEDTLDSADIDRVAYFTTNDDNTVDEGQRIHFAKKQPAVLKPNHYAVVGSSSTMYLGMRDATENEDTAADKENTYPQRLELSAGVGGGSNQVGVVDTSGSRTGRPDGATGEIRDGVAIEMKSVMLMGGTVTTTESEATHKVRFSASEPASGYTFDSSNPATDEDKFFEKTDYVEPYDTASSLTGDTTTIAYRTVYLQRLADPTVAFHATNNPYLIVDSMPVDLTAYSGEEPSSRATKLDTRCRDGHSSSGSAVGNIWRQSTEAPASGSLDSPLPTQTLGYLNEEFDPPITTGDYKGDPKETPFPWLVWNNRPFFSAHELLSVPPLSARELLEYHSTVSAVTNPYAQEKSIFGHLPNFFFSSATAGESPHMARILDFVQTPSPFSGTSIWLNPSQFAGTGEGTAFFHPPFNRVYTYRQPGKINLNTILSEDAFAALMNGRANDPGVELTWADFQRSRNGDPDANLPTVIAAPFRSASSSDQAPIAALQMNGVEATLLRKHPTATTPRPLFGSAATEAHLDPKRNPYFYHRGIQRLANLTTTHSNVYAIWITVGFFEVEEVDADADHRDGFRLVRELGIDTGEIHRHRGFYVVDRSIPVASQRGRKYNVHRAIILDRFIE